jgi:hypothetical protein
MIQEEKDLLLQDLCARLPYGVKYRTIGSDFAFTLKWIDKLNRLDGDVRLENVKIFLRPMSSMTKEEEDELCELCTLSDCNVYSDWEFCGVEIINSHPIYGTYFSTDYSAINWLNKNMFDYRGLIEKGLAIEVTEENNPYKD